MAAGRTMRVVTTNQGKVLEFRAALEPSGFTVKHVNREYPEIQAGSFEEVVRFGMRWLRDKGLRGFIIEDAGLLVAGLGGFPGVYSKFVYQTIGCEGILRLMEGISDRQAEFVSVIGLRTADRNFLIRGRCKGTIATSARGRSGFGFDPIFVPAGSRRTFGEITTEEKNMVSHRGDAIRRLRSVLRTIHGTGDRSAGR